MEQETFNKAIFDYTVHIADCQSRMTEALTLLGQQMVTITASLVTISAQGQATAAILERVVQTTDRTEQMTGKILAGLAPDKVSH